MPSLVIRESGEEGVVFGAFGGGGRIAIGLWRGSQFSSWPPRRAMFVWFGLTLYVESPCNGGRGETKVNTCSRSRLGGKKINGLTTVLVVATSSLHWISWVVSVWVPMLPTDLDPSHELGPKGCSSSMAGVEDVVTFEAPPALDHMNHKIK